MKAHTLKENGGVENLILTDIPVPAISPGEVLIKVKAISVNPVDAYVRQNAEGMKFFMNPAADEERIIGWDIAGVVESVGAQVKTFKPGDAVFGLVNFAGHGRGYAEYVAAPAGHLSKKPANVSFEEAAGATLAALTAWQALTHHADVKAGEKVVIHAAAGGVGHYAVQIAKHLGAVVIAATSEQNAAFAKSIGADTVALYGSDNFQRQLQDADVVIESLGGDHTLQALSSVKEGGRLVSLLTFIEGGVKEKAEKLKIQATRMIVKSSGEDTQQIAKLLESGDLKTHISHMFAFADLRLAHQQIETRRSIGKVIVSLQ
jgi:NADPH:quinone reductase-like Zn-dependent oxidoreductase